METDWGFEGLERERDQNTRVVWSEGRWCLGGGCQDERSKEARRWCFYSSTVLSFKLVCPLQHTQARAGKGSCDYRRRCDGRELHQHRWHSFHCFFICFPPFNFLFDFSERLPERLLSSRTGGAFDHLASLGIENSFTRYFCPATLPSSASLRSFTIMRIASVCSSGMKQKQVGYLLRVVFSDR